MKEYTIIFNGKAEKWVVSDEEMTFDNAQEWIKEHRRTSATVGELWAIDSEMKKPRWLLLKEAGAKSWCWAGEDPEELDKENPRNAYYVNLDYGSVGNANRTGNGYALCHVCHGVY